MNQIRQTLVLGLLSSATHALQDSYYLNYNFDVKLDRELCALTILQDDTVLW